MMTLEELAKALGLDTEENKDKLSILKKEYNAKANEVVKLTKKAEKLEEETAASKAVSEKFDIVKKYFGLDTDAEDFDEMLDGVKEELTKNSGGGVTPEEVKTLKRELTKATRDKDKAVKELETLNTQLAEEKKARITTSIKNEVRKALDTSKVIKADQFVDGFMTKVNVDEDGQTFTMRADDGSELSINDFITDWAKDNPEFVRSETAGGTGSGLGTKTPAPKQTLGGNKGVSDFMARLIPEKGTEPQQSFGELFAK